MKKMKKQAKYGLMILALCLGLQITTHAQDIAYGVKAGALYNMPSYGNKAVGNSDSKFGVQAGVFARTTQKLYVEGELAFSTFKSAYTFQQKSYNPTFYQLNVPVQLGYKLVETDRMNLRGSLGAQVNYNLKKNKATDNADFKTVLYDGIVSLGTDIDQFSIDLRYNHSINKTSKDLESRNRMIGLSFGYKF